MSSKQRNGMIDLARMLCAICIAGAHFQTTYLEEVTTLFNGGPIAVEYFFILSGFLLAGSASRADASVPAWQSAWRTIKHKVISLYPVWFVALAATFVLTATGHDYSLGQMITMLQESTSAYLLITSLGLRQGVEILYSRYIPTLLLNTLILCPWLYKDRKKFTYTAAPLIVLFGFVYLQHTYGTLMKTDEWNLVIYSGALRGLSEMCLGVIAFEAHLWLKKHFQGRLTDAGRTFFTVVELASLGYGVFYMIMDFTNKMELGIVASFVLFITVAMSNLSWTGAVIHGRFWSLLGEWSLSLYLSHGFAVLIAAKLWGRMRLPLFVLAYLALCMGSMFAVHYGSKLLVCIARRVKKWLERIFMKPKEETEVM